MSTVSARLAVQVPARVGGPVRMLRRDRPPAAGPAGAAPEGPGTRPAAGSQPGGPTPTPPAHAALPALPGTLVHLNGRAGPVTGWYAAPAQPPQTTAPNRPPLLLVHSVNAAASVAEVRPLFEHAARHRPVLAIDLPGYGHSARSARPYTPRLMTDALLDALGWLQVHGPAAGAGAAGVAGPGSDVLALSLSCEFAARAATEAPALVRRLAFVSPTGFRGNRLRHGPAGGSLGPPWLLKLIQGPGAGWGRGLFRGLPRPGVIRYFLERTWGSKDIDEALWQACVATVRPPGAEHAPLHFLAAALFSSDVNALYEQLRQPVWVAHGTRGDFTDYRLLRTVTGRSNWQVRVWPDTGALMYFEQPQAFNAALDAFLA